MTVHRGRRARLPLPRGPKVIDHRDPRRVISAILELSEAVYDQRHNLFISNVSDNSTHKFSISKSPQPHLTILLRSLPPTAVYQEKLLYRRSLLPDLREIPSIFAVIRFEASFPRWEDRRGRRRREA